MLVSFYVGKGQEMTTDHQERARVRSRIGSLILEFCRRQVGIFHMEDLRKFVECEANREPFLGHIAPDSPGRILRQLRQEGYMGYVVISRAESLYKVTWVQERPAEQAELFAARAN